MTEEIINRWMKRVKGLGGGPTAHFVLSRDANGMYLTSCGKANSENFIDLLSHEMELVKNEVRARCKKCDFSPRSIRPEDIL
jgi:hypothetical protein